ncbi:MAG: hypothetical protein AAFX94_19980, partial [Myxococcota bacterium]
ERRASRLSFRSACAMFGSAIAAMKQAAFDHLKGPKEGAEDRFLAAHTSARSSYELIRLSSNSVEAQEAARFAIRYALGFWRTASGHQPREDEAKRGPLVELEDKMTELYRAVRAELGMRKGVFSEPVDLLPSSEEDESDSAT